MNVLNYPKQEQTNPFPPKFQIIQARIDDQGKLKKQKSVGVAYHLKEYGHFTVRLWTMLNDRFYLVPQKDDSSKFYLMVKEMIKNPTGKNKYHWNIVGNARLIPQQTAIRMEFDLFERPLFMSIFPDKTNN